MAVFLLTSGCAGALAPPPATVPQAPAKELGAAPAPVELAEPEAPEAATQEPADGVIHVVQAGQTLWRIARAYDVPLDVVAEANGIADPTKVEIGTPVFIPGARMTLEVEPYPAPLRPPHRALPPPSFDAFLWPVAQGTLMRPFGEQRRTHKHAGVDIRGGSGQPILAARDGVVAFAGPTRGGYGSMVVLDHGDGVQSLYGHARKTLVKAGDTVKRGDTIALVGRTGNATTEHCHFEIRLANRPVDPMPYFVTAAEAHR
jgi:murein DD-endopeptidase MepM/ murein hydrolase activator NlpD